MQGEYAIEESYNVENITSNPLIQKLIGASVGHEEGFMRVQPSGFIYPTVMQQYIDRIKKFEVKDDDIWICTFPKCGTTWTQEMVWCLMNNLDFDKSKQIDLDIRTIFLEWKGLLSPGRTSSIADQIDLAAALPSPRIIKTHLPFTMLPDQIRTRAKTPKLVHVVRNSRDTCVSMFHHWKLLDGFVGEFELWSELFYEGLSAYCSPFFKHVETYYLSNYPNMLFLKYEDMKKDLKKSATKTASFVGKEFSDTDMDRLVDHLSFKNFVKNPSLNKKRHVKHAEDFGSSKPVEGKGFIRKGQVGDWVNHFSPEMSEKFLKKEDELFESTGLRL